MVSILSLREDLSFSQGGPFFFSQKNTDEQNTQHLTETLSQPISQNVTANTHHPSPTRSLTPSPSPNGEGSDLIERGRSISHRKTQMNRTHSIPQRH